MANFIYDLNSYIKTDATLISLSGKASLDVEPMAGDKTTNPPVILWWWYPGVRSGEEFYFKRDQVKYVVLDTDAARMVSMAERIIELINKGPGIRTVSSASNTGRWSYLRSGSMDAPKLQRDGFYRMELIFEVAWMQNA